MAFMKGIKNAFNKNRLKSTAMGVGGGALLASGLTLVASAFFPPAILALPFTAPAGAIGGGVAAYKNNKPK